MPLPQLYINNQLADLTDAIRIQLEKEVSDFRNPQKKTGAISMPFALPYTAKNKNIFFNEQDKQIIGKFRRKYEARLVVNGEILIQGEFRHKKNSVKGFEGALVATKLTNPRLADILGDKKLTDIKSFTKIDFNGNESVYNSWASLVAYPDAEVCYPYVIPSFSHLNSGFASTYEDLGISHFMSAIIKRIFEDAGYEVEGEIFDSVTFQKLFILYSSTDKQAWNYGKLNIMNAGLRLFFVNTVYNVNTIKTIERSNDTIFVITYPFKVNSGDLSTSLGTDGVYTCKFSGLYTFTCKGSHVATIATNSIASTAFTAFRCISDDETIPENLIPSSTQFASLTSEYLDNGTIAVGQAVDFSFTARLEEGKQYQLQRYVSIANNALNGATPFFYSDDSGKFNITACDGPLLVNPALFLPDMTQVELIQAVFRIYNLYYQLNETEKTVTLITRDNYFQEALNTVVDMSPYLNVLNMNETPLSDAEIEQTYLTYATDDNDYILKQTNYLELVNGAQPEGATVLPFAPIPFIQVSYNAGTFSAPILGNDILPAILPDTSSEDTSVLSDYSSVSSSSRVPRLGLYNGTGWLQPFTPFTPLLMQVGLGRYTPPTQNVLGQSVGGGYEYTAYPPKLNFFDYDNQPAYKVVTNLALRSFKLELSQDDTIYDTADTTFLVDADRTPELNLISLAPNIDETINPKGFFFGLYSNDLLIGNLSNYFEGQGRINPNLFQKLTGRQVLRVKDDLFLLDSIKAFDVSGDFATYKLYKLLANTGAVTTSAIRYTSTQSYTATCPAGTIGTSTKSATRSSFVSQAAADTAALTAAQAEAELYLVCVVDTPSSFTSTQTVTVYCPGGYEGNPSTETASYTSAISQLDADTQAYLLAEASAMNNLYCNLIE